MDYLKSLLELIRAKEELSGNNNICLSLQEIADVWDRKSVLEESYRAIAENVGYVDKDFLNDVASTFKKLESQNFIKFKFFLREDYSVDNKLNSIADILRSTYIKDKIFLKIKGGDEITTLYLTNTGDLYREPKNKYSYPMGQGSNRHKIIRFLIQDKGYQQTELIRTESGSNSEQTIRTEIGKIKNNIEKYLKTNGKDFLQGKKGSGYRINPKYKVILKDE